MNIETYFREALKREAYLNKRWVFSFFAVVMTPEDTPLAADDIIGLIRTEERAAVMLDDEWIDLTGWKVNQPFALTTDTITLQKGDLVNVFEETKTTYGHALWNALISAHPFKGKMLYVNELVTGKVISKFEDDLIAKIRLNQISIDELDMYIALAINQLTSFSQICIPSASDATISTHKSTITLRNKLLKENKDQLDNSTVMTKIENELIAHEKEAFKDEEATGFYLKDKSYDIVRKRTHIMHGAEKSFDENGTIETIPMSLQEGWNVEHLPALINSSRAASYDRGKETAKGGAEVKDLQRAFQNTKVSEADCGSKIGYPVTIIKEEPEVYMHRYMISGAKLVLLDETTIKKFIGKTIMIRSPLACKTKDGNFCKTCVGTKIGEHKSALMMLIVAIGSSIMLSSMKSMHGTALRLTKLDIKDSIL